MMFERRAVESATRRAIPSATGSRERGVSGEIRSPRPVNK